MMFTLVLPGIRVVGRKLIGCISTGRLALDIIHIIHETLGGMSGNDLYLTGFYASAKSLGNACAGSQSLRACLVHVMISVIVVMRNRKMWKEDRDATGGLTMCTNTGWLSLIFCTLPP